jgi:signal transduction histidine kinase
VYWLLHDITAFKQAIAQAQNAERALHQSWEQLRTLTAHLQHMQEQERTRIAREIHDELAQTLTGLKMDIAWFAKRLATAPPAWQERLTAMTATLTTLFQTVRRIGTELRPYMLDELGLLAAMTWYTQEVCQRASLAYELHIPTEEVSLDQERATALFRIFQEALTNVVRHAEASQVRVCMVQYPDAVRLEVADNGKGCPAERLTERVSMGILGMRERASLWGGELTIAERPGGGTALTVRLPSCPVPV